jgi:hypothetical protein
VVLKPQSCREGRKHVARPHSAAEDLALVWPIREKQV